MGKIILSSNGIINKTADSASYILNLCQNKKVLVVDNATTGGSNVAGLKSVMLNFDGVSLLKRETLSNQNLNIIYDYDIIYIVGGDLKPFYNLSFPLLKEEFVKFLNEGKIIIGESAGAIILGKSTKYYYDLKRGTKDKYNVHLNNYNGLDLVDVMIFPHWDKQLSEMKEKVFNYEIENNIKIIPLNDGEFLELNK